MIKKKFGCQIHSIYAYYWLTCLYIEVNSAKHLDITYLNANLSRENKNVHISIVFYSKVNIIFYIAV